MDTIFLARIVSKKWYLFIFVEHDTHPIIRHLDKEIFARILKMM